MTKGVIIFSGFNPRAVVAFLRTLEKNDVQYGIITKSTQDPIYHTAYKSHIVADRVAPNLDLSDILDKIRVAQNKLLADSYVIAPSTEALNRFLLENKSEFEKVGCEIPLVDNKLYETVSDKQAFGDLCKDKGIAVPKEYDTINKAQVPFVAKPKSYYSKNGEAHIPVLIFDENQKSQFADTYDQADFYYQEFIGGESNYLLYYFYKSGEVVKFSQVNYMQQPQGKSIIGAISSDLHNSDESQRYEKLFLSLGFHGLVMVEVKKYQGKYYMLEANPRFWGPSQLFVDAGVNLFEAFLYDQGLLDTKPTLAKPTSSIRYFWFGGYRETVGSGNEVSYHSYSPEQYAEDASDWLKADVYDREDTREFFKWEAELI